MSERTFVMLKPGTLQRRIAGEVLVRFERKGLKIIALKLIQMSKTLAETHYAEHRGRDYYDKLIEYTLSGPVIVMILEGEDAISLARRLAGPVTLNEQQAGTIRGDYAACTRLNIIHSSDSAESASRETALFFTGAEICEWEDGNARWF
ncbi:MAG: nucleoside-diphosphate kinase [Treponema sp.]|nr:nucleoside-diphosphate kinase [Treponema sp.]